MLRRHLLVVGSAVIAAIVASVTGKAASREAVRRLPRLAAHSRTSAAVTSATSGALVPEVPEAVRWTRTPSGTVPSRRETVPRDWSGLGTDARVGPVVTR